MKRFVAPVLGLVVLAASILLARRSSEAHPAAASAAPSFAPTRVLAEGRVVTYPGAEVAVGTDFGGRVTRVLVDEKAIVRKGDLLAELDADAERASLGEASARVTEAEADIRLARFELERAEKLLASKVGTRQAVDRAQRDLENARARAQTAEAEVRHLSAVIAKSRIVAPLSGTVLARHVQPGETLERGAKVVTIADLSRLRVEAEVDEFDTERIALGAKVQVRAEGDRAVHTGRVEEVPDAVTPRRLKPQDPGRPSDTRVLLVKVALEDPGTLLLGRRVEVEIR